MQFKTPSLSLISQGANPSVLRILKVAVPAKKSDGYGFFTEVMLGWSRDHPLPSVTPSQALLSPPQNWEVMGHSQGCWLVLEGIINQLINRESRKSRLKSLVIGLWQ